jgi:hypothetical protein
LQFRLRRQPALVYSEADIAVSIHSGSVVEGGAHIASRIAGGSGCIAVLSPGDSPTTAMWRDDFLSWSPTGRFHYIIAGSELPGICDDARLRKLIEVLVLHQEVGLVLEDGSDDLVVLEEVAKIHIVARDDVDGVAKWRLTSAALASVQCAVVTDGPYHVFEPRAGLPLEDMSKYELMLCLAARGWEWRRLPQNLLKRSPL